jgi:hypothetical protein
MYACTETDVRNQRTTALLLARKGTNSRGETFHPLYAASFFSSSAERTVYCLA